MTTEFRSFQRDLAATFFHYAHISGAVELYMQVLETPALQKAFSKTMTGEEIEWKMLHRFMMIGDKRVVWYPELPVPAIIQEKNNIIGLLYGICLSKMIGLVDYYFASLLKSRFGHTERSGSSWDAFSQKTKIDLLAQKNGTQVYALLQERHKIEHNNARIDQTFVDRMMKKSITHSYSSGDAIQKSHLDVLAARDAIAEFVAEVDGLMK
jgi:hypothetical protein